MADLKIFSGNANRRLAMDICNELGAPLGEALVGTFKNGETRVKIEEHVRGADVFVIQPTSEPTDHHIIELLIMIDALRRASADRITAVIPYYAYAKQEKKTSGREPISSKLVANLIVTAGADRVLAVDLHAPAIQGFFDIPVDHLTAEKLLANYIRKMRLENAVIVSPDIGGAKRAGSIARLLDLPIAFVYKRRPKDDVVAEQRVVGDVAGMNAVVVDDLISTGGTLVGVSHALKAEGARSVRVLATHGIFAGNAVEKLIDSPIDEIVTTDSVPQPGGERHPKLKVLSVAPLLAEAILRVHEDRSVSELFN
jgi:ribose-phosphate pyrophosphokinase